METLSMDRWSRFLPLVLVALFVGFFAWAGRGGSLSMMLSPLSAPAPALALSDLQGGKHSLADYRGQVVIVHFWATWCGPCRHEIPGLSALARELDAKGLALLAIHVGESATSLPAFLQQTPIAGHVLQDGNSEVFHRWGGEVIPTTYVVGRDGQVHFVSRGEVDWSDAKNRQRLEELLATQAPHDRSRVGRNERPREFPPSSETRRGDASLFLCPTKEASCPPRATNGSACS